MKTDLSAYIDHTLLKPDALISDINRLLEEAEHYSFKGVCVSPYFVEHAKKKIEKSEVLLSTVVGFPFGYSHIRSKIAEVKAAVNDGVDEIDLVLNIAAVKNENWSFVENEIDIFTTETKRKNNKILKLIFETAYLSSKEIITLCNLCNKYNVDFAKTSTGYADRGVSIEDVELLREHLDATVKIKASGGIKNAKFAQELINAGADRLGTSSSVTLVNKN